MIMIWIFFKYEKHMKKLLFILFGLNLIFTSPIFSMQRAPLHQEQNIRRKNLALLATAFCLIILNNCLKMPASLENAHNKCNTVVILTILTVLIDEMERITDSEDLRKLEDVIIPVALFASLQAIYYYLHWFFYFYIN